MATTAVTLHARGSFRTEVIAGPHRFLLDEPVDAGGEGAGPTPYDMLAAALGGCTAMTLQYYAKRETLPLEGVDITVTHDRQHAKDCADCMTRSGYIHRFKLDIELQGPLTDAQRATLMDVANRCPVKKTLGSEIKIDVVAV